jgi:hypothetical protein
MVEGRAEVHVVRGGARVEAIPSQRTQELQNISIFLNDVLLDIFDWLPIADRVNRCLPGNIP